MPWAGLGFVLLSPNVPVNVCGRIGEILTTGTRQHFGDWLAVQKHMTYSFYSKLETAAKLSIQKEYRGKG